MSNSLSTSEVLELLQASSKKRKASTAVSDVPPSSLIIPTPPSSSSHSALTKGPSEPNKKKRKHDPSAPKASSALAEGADLGVGGQGQNGKDGQENEDREAKRLRKAEKKERKEQKEKNKAAHTLATLSSSAHVQLPSNPTTNTAMPTSTSNPAATQPTSFSSAAPPPPSVQRMIIRPPPLPSNLTKPKPKPKPAAKPKTTTSKTKTPSSSASDASVAGPSNPSSSSAAPSTKAKKAPATSSSISSSTPLPSPSTSTSKKSTAKPSSAPSSSSSDIDSDPPSDSDSPSTIPAVKAKGPISTPSTGYPPHIAALISEKFYKSDQLMALEKEHGFEAKRGKWSKAEEELCEGALDHYAQTHAISSSEVRDLIFDTGKKNAAHAKFWHEIGARIPGRPLRLILLYLRRRYDDLSRLGPWTAAEDAKLKAAYLAHGPQWKKIEPMVLRSSGDCKDRWTKQLDPKLADADKGHWTKEDTDSLSNVITEMLASDDAKGTVNWEIVSAKLGSKRSPHQCMTRWQTVQSSSSSSRQRQTWSIEENTQLLTSLSAFKDVSEVQWNVLAKDFDDRSGVHLKKHWEKLEARMEGETEGMKFKDTVQHILTKVDVLTKKNKEKVKRTRKKQSNKSKETIETDSEEDSD